MNGIHDLGGMDGLGPILPSADETPFDAPWEARAFAHLLALGVLGKWNNDAIRRSFESFEAQDYLRMRYFERWNAGLVDLLLETGVLTEAAVRSGRADPSGRTPTPLRAEDVPGMIASGEPYDRDLPNPPLFHAGAVVRTKNVHPVGHTRLPRYARDKTGVVERCHGGYVFPDTNSQFLGEHAQPLYSVRFEAGELWGPRGAQRSPVFIDIWEQHLEPR